MTSIPLLDNRLDNIVYEDDNILLAKIYGILNLNLIISLSIISFVYVNDNLRNNVVSDPNLLYSVGLILVLCFAFSLCFIGNWPYNIYILIGLNISGSYLLSVVSIYYNIIGILLGLLSLIIFLSLLIIYIILKKKELNFRRLILFGVSLIILINIVIFKIWLKKPRLIEVLITIIVIIIIVLYLLLDFPNKVRYFT
jgi:FtsH-binding integral membrane protein